MGKKASLGAAEAEVLRYISDHYPVAGRVVADYFAQLRGLTKTTTLNVIDRLREKGFLTRELVEGVFHYSPTQSQPAVLRGQVAHFIESMLGGSLEPFAAYLAEKESISDAELARLREIITKLEEKR